MDEMELLLRECREGTMKNLFGDQPKGYRQYSTEHWEVIDGMDQMAPRFLEERLREVELGKKKYDERHYNVYVYKVLPTPPGLKEGQDFLRKSAELSGYQ
jgi:hypothetical protein